MTFFNLFNCGISLEQISQAFGQRVWNGQPEGGSEGLGTSPVKWMRSVLSSASTWGIADKRASV